MKALHVGGQVEGALGIKLKDVILLKLFHHYPKSRMVCPKDISGCDAIHIACCVPQSLSIFQLFEL